MTDYAAMTLIPNGHTAFTATYRPEAEKEQIEAEERRKEHNRIKQAQKRIRLAAKRVNPYSDIGRSTGLTNSEKAAR